uniref:type I restriction endonuclease subunit R n=1 Tax=Candidatus Laterigemmans baculatus TaxID=2770505 RepID=UPI0013DC5D6F
MSLAFNETTVEQAALDWLAELGYSTASGPELAPDGDSPERDSFGDVVLAGRLREAIDRLNPDVPAEARDEALRNVLRIDAPTLIAANRRFHAMLRDGVEVEYRRDDGSIAGDRVRLLNCDSPAANDFLAVNQFTVQESGHTRRPDVVVFVNGLPIAVLELKSAADQEATIDDAFKQLGTYEAQIPSLFHYNELLVVSDGHKAQIGSLTAGREWFKPWRTVEEERPVKGKTELEILIRGALAPERLLPLVQNFVLFEDDTDSDRVHKILAGYHQFHAAQAAIESTVAASRPGGDHRGGVVWHTQGSGKSFTMLFYAGLVVADPRMNNPTLVVLTDRNDLDDQLFGQFQRCYEILRQKPVQADSIEHLRELLQVASGGVVFTTVHKFAETSGKFPTLTERSNVVVIADEAHRSQYGFRARRDKKDPEKISYGFARNIRDALPNASFIGFTGTPIEQSDKNTRAVFGDYISVYDIQRAVEDKATVPIYYESRVIKLALEDKAVSGIDDDFEAITEEEESETREKLKSRWAALESMVGDDDRIRVLARDVVEHFEKRLESLDGKGMIVCMSRRICVELYDEIIRLRPEWAGKPQPDGKLAQDGALAQVAESPEARTYRFTKSAASERDIDDDQGFVKVIMTGSASDGAEWQKHIRTKQRRRALATQFKDPSSPFRLVIVRDMWLTGFDAPSLHTMYVDKPMQGHGLMQAIARVNRVFREKPGGLVVDYLGIGDALQKALRTYTESGGKGQTTVDTREAVEALQKHYELCCDMLHGFDWSRWTSGRAGDRLSLMVAAQDFLLEQEEGRQRWIAHVDNLSRAFALCPTSEYAHEIREDVAFFQIVRTAFRKYSPSGKSESELDHAVRQLVSKAVVTASDEVIDVFAAAGMERPDVSILSDEFLEEVRSLPYKNVAAELLKKLLSDEVKFQAKRNVTQSRSFSEMLKQVLTAYHNRSISTVELIDDLIKMAKSLQAAQRRGEELGLSDDEICFYDALAQNESAMEAMGSDELKVIATELVQTVRRSVTIDWTERESARARIRVLVRRILRKHGYPPDLQAEATKEVLEQAAVLCEGWV